MKIFKFILILFSTLFMLCLPFIFPKSVSAAVNDPCKVCVGSNCITVDAIPYCSSSVNECSTDAGCGGSSCDASGASCSYNSECCSGYCNRGVCAGASLPPSQYKCNTSTGNCSADSNGAYSELSQCENNCRVSTTPTCDALGYACSTNGECCSGYCDGTCKSAPNCKSNGYSCVATSDCCDGYCDTYCRPRPTATPTPPSCLSSGSYCSPSGSATPCCSGLTCTSAGPYGYFCYKTPTATPTGTIQPGICTGTSCSGSSSESCDVRCPGTDWSIALCGEGSCGSNEVKCEIYTNTGTYCGEECAMDVRCVSSGGSCTGGSCVQRNPDNYECGNFGCGNCQRPLSQIWCDNNGDGTMEYCNANCSNYTTSCEGVGSCPSDGSGNPNTGGSPSCSITLLPSSLRSPLGAVNEFRITVDSLSNGTISAVSFISSDENIVAVETPLDTDEVYSTNVSGHDYGFATITASAIIAGDVTCMDTVSVEISNAESWWQVKDADVVTTGGLFSYIPATCTLPTCNPAFDLNGDGGFPGVVIYGTQYDFQAGMGSGIVGEAPNSWIANTSYGGKWYGYSYFWGQLPDDIESQMNETGNNIDNAYLASGLSTAQGYTWLHYDGQSAGDLTLSDLTISGRKVILFTENADVYINGNITLANPATDFFMLIAGTGSNSLKGNVLISPTIPNIAGPELTGLFLAEGELYTGAGTTQLHIRGSIVSYGGISLERNLDDDSVTPAEFFEYAPELVQLFPSIFKQTRMRWKEVVP